MSAAQARQEASWSSLPAELQARVFDEFEDRDRCQITPLICKAADQVHKTEPPGRKHCCIAGPVKPSMLRWLTRRLPYLEVLDLQQEGGTPMMLPRLLHAAATAAPNLWDLHIDVTFRRDTVLGNYWTVHHRERKRYQADGKAVFASLAGLSQLKRLHVGNMVLPVCGSGIVPMLTGLCSLQAISLDIGTDHGAELWATLAALPLLENAAVCCTWFPCFVGGQENAGNLLRDIGLLTQIRDLELSGTTSYRWSFVLPKSLSRLTQLSRLVIPCAQPCLKFRPILGLPMLENLEIIIMAGTTPVTRLDIRSKKLRSLVIAGGRSTKVEDLVSLDMPSLAGLESLSLPEGRLQDFSPSMAAALISLTHLGLQQNHLAFLPPALSQITTLRRLNLAGNHASGFHLRAGDVVFLRALPALKRVVLHPDTTVLMQQFPNVEWS